VDTILRRAEPAAERLSRDLPRDRDSGSIRCEGASRPSRARPGSQQGSARRLAAPRLPGRQTSRRRRDAGRSTPRADPGRPPAVLRRPFVSPSTLRATRATRPHVDSAMRTPPRDTASSIPGSRDLQRTPLDRSSGVMRRCTGQARKEDVFGRGRATRPLGPTRRDQAHKHEGQGRDALGTRTAQPGTLAPHRQQRYSERSRGASSISTTSPSRSGHSCGDGRIRTSGRVSPLQPLSRRLLSATQPRLRAPS
jgi:hypothetical protein